MDFALLGLGGGDGDGEPQSAAAGVWDVKLYRGSGEEFLCGGLSCMLS